MLPKLLGGVRYRGLVEHQRHFTLLDEIISKVKMDESISNDQYDNILNHDFLFEEYHRVIYGLQVGISKGEETYLTIKRKGRGNNPSVPKNSYRRQLAWKCLTEYAQRMHSENIQSFTLRRQYLYSKLKSGELKLSYDYILVDEFQDCTDADFEIFYSMIKNPNNFTIAGDLAQSIHLGTAARIPNRGVSAGARPDRRHRGARGIEGTAGVLSGLSHRGQAAGSGFRSVPLHLPGPA
jgi:superfamily I DNA/RNA helicase